MTEPGGGQQADPMVPLDDRARRAMQGLADDMGALQKSSSPAQTASERTVRETMRSELDRLGALIADARSGRARSPRR